MVLLPHPAPAPVSVPVFAALVPAGFPSPAADYVEGTLDLNEHLIRRPAATFFVRIIGDSMIGAGIHHGDLAIFRSCSALSGRSSRRVSSEASAGAGSKPELSG